MVEPDSMPGNASFIAGFAQSNVRALSTLVVHVELICLNRLVILVRTLSEHSARALVKVMMANLVTSYTLPVARLSKTVMVGECKLINGQRYQY